MPPQWHNAVVAAGGAIILIGTAGCGFYGQLTHNSTIVYITCMNKIFSRYTTRDRIGLRKPACVPLQIYFILLNCCNVDVNGCAIVVIQFAFDYVCVSGHANLRHGYFAKYIDNNYFFVFRFWRMENWYTTRPTSVQQII